MLGRYPAVWRYRLDSAYFDKDMSNKCSLQLEFPIFAEHVLPEIKYNTTKSQQVSLSMLLSGSAVLCRGWESRVIHFEFFVDISFGMFEHSVGLARCLTHELTLSDEICSRCWDRVHCLGVLRGVERARYTCSGFKGGERLYSPANDVDSLRSRGVRWAPWSVSKTIHLESRTNMLHNVERFLHHVVRRGSKNCFYQSKNTIFT